MSHLKQSINEIGIRAGLYTCAAFIGYFLLMKLFGLNSVPQLRYFNFFILVGGIYYSYRQLHPENRGIPFLSGFGLGMLVTGLSVSLFSAFLYTYLMFIDPNLMAALKANMPDMFGEHLTPFYVSLAVFVEGLCSGLIMTFAFIQYYKSDTRGSEYSL